MKELPVRELEALSLFLIPYSSDSAFLWCPETPSGAISDIFVPGEQTTVRARKKLFRPGGGIEVFLVQGSGLRDGAACELQIGSEIHTRRAQLARWDDPDARAVMKLAARHLAKEGRPAPILARYLAFISAWQAAGCVLEAFSDGQIIEIDAPCSRAQVSAYGVTAHGLSRLTVHVLMERAGKTILWLAEPDVEYLYLELDDNLIRINLDASSRRVPSRKKATIAEDDAILVEALYQVVRAPSGEVHAWAADQCLPQEALHHRNAVLTVVKAVRLPSSDLCVFLKVAGSPEIIQGITLTPFGSSGPIEAEIVRCDSDDATSDWQQQIIVKATNINSSVGAYRIDCLVAGEEQSVWICETNSRQVDKASLAREFMSVAAVKPEWFESVIAPLAMAYGHQTEPGLVGVRSFGAAIDAQADVYVFAGSDIEALHRTIIGLAVTSRNAPIKVCIVLANHSVFDRTSASAERWSQIYQLAIEIRCYTARSTEAQVTRSIWPTVRPGFYCRAGTVPPHSNWLGQTVRQFASARATMLVGYMMECGRPIETVPGAADLFRDLGQPAGAEPSYTFAAVAVAPNRPLSTGLPRLFSLEAFLAAQAAQDHSATSIDLCFMPSGTMSHADEFDYRLDRSSLQRNAKSSLASGKRVIKLPSRAKS